jgi:predicted GNAT family N-acyltransferase
MRTTEPAFTVHGTDWASHAVELYAVRRRVFVEEQGVPEALEQDEFDPLCWHVLARDEQHRPIGTGRLLPDGQVGRLAVLKPWRGRGVGRALMGYLLALARQHGFTVLELHAQVQAQAFYAGFGFAATGEVFMEAGLPHRIMRLTLPATTFSEERP